MMAICFLIQHAVVRILPYDAMFMFVFHKFPFPPQGMFSTLELVPMWSGVDHDVEIFASGIVAEDEGDWGTKDGAAAGGSGGVASGEPRKPIC